MKITDQYHDDAAQSLRRLARKALFTEDLQPGDAKARGQVAALSMREVLTPSELNRASMLTESEARALEVLLRAGGDVRRAHTLYEPVTYHYFRVLCKRAGARLQGTEYSYHNVDANGVPYSRRKTR